MLMNERFRSEQGSDFKKRKRKEIKVGRLLSHAIARWGRNGRIGRTRRTGPCGLSCSLPEPVELCEYDDAIGQLTPWSPWSLQCTVLCAIGPHFADGRVDRSLGAYRC
jgi:hypothetical protein